MPKRIRRHQPSRPKLEKAINDILDKAINADSANAPKQLHLILTTEHPEWKLPERRVAKYLKRQLKERNNMKYKQIDADLDEVSLYSTTSTSTWRTSSEVAPVPAPAPAPAPKTDIVPDKSPQEKQELEKVTLIQEPMVTSSQEPKVSSIQNGNTKEGADIQISPKTVPVKDYEDDNENTEESPLFCEGVNCIIS